MKKIALVAHDNKKIDMVQFCVKYFKWNFGFMAWFKLSKMIISIFQNSIFALL